MLEAFTDWKVREILEQNKMSSLLRGMMSSLGGEGGRDAAIKSSLISQLSVCVKDLQVEQAFPDSDVQGTTETHSALCVVLEAMFIHGLKDSFLQRVSLAVRSELDVRPDPNFWGPLLVVLHRDVINQLTNLNLVQTDVGRCRAWLRLALNEGLLSRYLEAIRCEGQKALSHYYRRGSMLRDADLLDVAQRLLEGIESYPFALPINSSLLDSWTIQPLLQAGLWTPPVRATADSVAVATDAAEVLDRVERENSALDAVSIATFASFQSDISQAFSFNEEDALKRILGTPVDEAPIAARQRADESMEERRALEQTRKNEKQPDTAETEKEVKSTAEKNEVEGEGELMSSVGNSLASRSGWSSSFEGTQSNAGQQPKEGNTAGNRKSSLLPNTNMLQSFHSLIESYKPESSTTEVRPDLSDFMQRFEPGTSNNSPSSANSGADLSYPQGLGYEVIDNSPSSCYAPEFGSLLQQVTKLPRELGLDSQNYLCAGCPQQIGVNFIPARVCALTGQYFCVECTVNQGEEWVVPARILFNWDFRRFIVSKRAANFLSEVQQHPLLNLKVINPYLYIVVAEVDEVQKLRNELNLLRAYLFTCREPVIEELQKQVWPREYLYEHVHLYSISDLLQIPTGALAQLLKQVISFARNHVYECWLCSQKGFVCEMCKDVKVIYPFDTNTTYRCEGCSAVFHSRCLSAKKPCPKCERRRNRADTEFENAAEES